MDHYQGADAAGLEEKIKQHTENDAGNEDSDIPKGYVSGKRKISECQKVLQLHTHTEVIVFFINFWFLF